MSSEHSLSLWQIDEAIAQLIETREDILSDRKQAVLADPIEAAKGDAQYTAELAAVEQELARYIGEQLPAKVDGYIGLIRRDEAVADAAEREAERFAAIAKDRRERVAWLKQTALGVINAAYTAGRLKTKRLEGRAGGSLRVQTNGGHQPVEITEPSLLPDEFCDVHIRMAATWWKQIAAQHPSLQIKSALLMERVPRLKDIGAELQRPCEKCGGKGITRMDGSIDNAFEGSDYDEKQGCVACDGRGRRCVPGAHLGERGEHVRVG